VNKGCPDTKEKGKVQEKSDRIKLTISSSVVKGDNWTVFEDFGRKDAYPLTRSPTRRPYLTVHFKSSWLV